MCGIVGLYYKDPERRVAPPVIERMCEKIVHRGPDDQGIFVDGNFGMGMRRLSIVDLEGGRQPIANEDGNVVTVYNGEIYNYPELKRELASRGHRFATRSDTETLVHGYEEWGDALPERLNGMFAFSIWDRRKRRLLLARDHVGVKPLYLYEDEQMLAWASEIKALLVVPGITAELDQHALVDYLTFGYVPAPRTLFRRISKLPPASRLRVEAGKPAAIEEYWNLEYALDAEIRPLDAWCEELGALVDDAVSRQLMSDVPLGAFLSGGLDSSAIVAAMSHLGVERISTYAIGFGAEDAFHSELPKAQTVSRRFGTDHHEILVGPEAAGLIEPLVYHLDEPVTDTSFVVTYLVSKLARETVTVILSGVGGDEVFAGYRRYMWPYLQKVHRFVPDVIERPMRALISRLPVDRGSAVKSMFRYARGYLEYADLPDPERYQGYVRIFDDAHLDALLAPDLTGDGYRAGQVAGQYRRPRTGDPLNRMLYADLKTSLVDSLLTFTDKMSMAVSLEARVPLLDVRILEMAARLPPRLKQKGPTGQKHVFKQMLKSRLPESIVQQKKQGFGTPISRWFRSSLREMIGDLLSPERLASRGLFDPATVQRLVAEHQAERADHSEHILSLLTFEIWCRTFLDQGAAS